MNKNLTPSFKEDLNSTTLRIFKCVPHACRVVGWCRIHFRNMWLLFFAHTTVQASTKTWNSHAIYEPGSRHWNRKKRIIRIFKYSLWCSDRKGITVGSPNVIHRNYHSNRHTFPLVLFSSLNYNDSSYTAVRITKQRGHLSGTYFATCLIATSVITMLRLLM